MEANPNTWLSEVATGFYPTCTVAYLLAVLVNRKDSLYLSHRVCARKV